MQKLTRVLGLPGAVVLGLGSILGTGLFVSLGLAAGAAGYGLSIAIVLSAVVALCNGMSSASLAVNHPVSGGTYEYGYRYLNRPFGFLAGAMFLSAKSASAATAALGVVGYVANVIPGIDGASVNVAAAVLVLLLTVLVAAGLRRSTRATLVSVSITVVGLLILLVSVWAVDTAGYSSGRRGALHSALNNPVGFLKGAALVFVAFTGYGRVATLGEEVRAPRRTIPLAVLTTIAVVTVLYVAVAVASLRVATPQELVATARLNRAPLELVALRSGGKGSLPLIAVLIAAVTALFGVLLNLMLGLSRVVLAMGRRGDLPRFFARIDESKNSPVAAVVAVGFLVSLLALFGSVELNWSFSALTVLVYYAIANLAAMRLSKADRLIPLGVSALGLAGCLSLAFAIGAEVLLPGAVILGVVVLWFVASTLLSSDRTSS